MPFLLSFLFVFLISTIISVKAYSTSQDGFVENDPLYMLPVKHSSDYKLLDYKLRRPNWTSTASISYGLLSPKDYQPSFSTESFETIYGSRIAPLIEFNYSIKKNFSLGSLGLELGLGYFNQKSLDSETIDSQLTIVPVNLGVYYIIDNIWREPVVAPYIGGGIYTMVFQEKSLIQSSADELTEEIFKGRTKESAYVKAGLAFQVTWLERDPSMTSYIEQDIENTFLYIETTIFSKSNQDDDSMFTKLKTSAGLRLEF